MYKKLLCSLLACLLVLPIFGKTNFIYADEDDEEEIVEDVEEEEEEEVSNKSDREKCVEDKDEAACIAVAKNSKNNIAQLEKEIEEAQNNREEALSLAKEYAEKAMGYQNDIDNLQIEIEELKNKIEELEKEIAENEKKVDELNSRVKNRMVNYQKTMHFNGYLEFILGSKSFTDMLRRIYGVKSVTSKDKTDREEYIEVITKLNNDKIELDKSKQELDESYEELVNKQAELLVMKEFYEEKAEEIEAELEEMTAERDKVYDSFDDLKYVLKEIGYTINDGFVAAVHGSTIVEGVWHYSDGFLGGTWHTGVDYAAGYGTEIHAPAGGVVIRADDSCGYGYLGSACGEWIAGGGNQVYLMCEVDGVVYGFMFFHLSRVDVSYGDYVFQDEIIGTVGSSGSSTGPHCHIEMYKLGYGTLSEFLDMNWNVTFSCGRHETAYRNRCSASSTPCVCDPEDYLPG